MLSSRWPTVALRIEIEPQREGAVELADRAIRIEHEAWQRAGFEDTDQILRVAGQGQPVELALHGLAAQLGVASAQNVRKVEARLVRSGVALATSLTRAESRMRRSSATSFR